MLWPGSQSLTKGAYGRDLGLSAGPGALGSSLKVLGPTSSHSLSHQVMYGGRAIDSFDRRILTIYMDEYLGDFLFDTFQPFHFFRNKEVDYKIPTGDVKERFVGEISQIMVLFVCLCFHQSTSIYCVATFPDRHVPSCLGVHQAIQQNPCLLHLVCSLRKGGR